MLARGEVLSHLLIAFELVSRRGTGGQAWAAPIGDDPLAFLLDSVSDAMNVWQGGRLLYRNRAALRLGLGRCDGARLEDFYVQGRHFERRSLRCGWAGRDYVLEIIRELDERVR